jgi:hypothetical protein
MIVRCGVAMIGVMIAAGTARADDAPFRIGARPAWFLLGGVTGGGTVGVDQRGGYVGGELSVVRLKTGKYIGLYGDGYYDFGIDGTYATAGLEIGRKFFGVDGGVALRWAGDGTEVGATGRVFASIGLFSIYARYAYFDSMEDDNVIQIGGMLKLPLMSPFGGGR